MAGSNDRYRLYGVTRSYFTRKLSGYLDYKGIPWLFRRSAMQRPEILASGWPGAMPVLRAPDGRWMWDSTAVIHHLDRRFPDRGVLPPDPVQRFLCYVIEDVLDEWLYRPAVGTRWFVEDNRRIAGWEIGRELSVEVPVTGEQAAEMVEAYVTSSCAPMGVTAANVQCWIDEVLRPWQRVVGSHLAGSPYLFGARPSLADFALFGANAAHFVADRACRRWTDEDAPAVVAHTHRLLEPEDQSFGEWAAPGEVPETLIAVLRDAGRLYLPWAARATIEGRADLVFDGGDRVTIVATDFLREQRAILLARYLALRSDTLDAILDRAGILGWFAGHVAQAGTVPGDGEPPRPVLNQPFPPAAS